MKVAITLIAAAGLKNFNGSVNLVLDAKAQEGALTMASGSADKLNTYVFQVAPQGVQDSAAKSISYWSTGNGDDTMVTVWNPADEAQDFLFTLNYSSGHYRLPLHLEPRATRTFNISAIIQNQIPDDQGNIIPLAIHEGSAKIAGTQADNQQILVAMAAGTYNVRKATCTYYCISCDGEVLAYVDDGETYPFTVGSSSQFYLLEKWNTGDIYYTSFGTWSSANTNIATVGSSNGMGNGISVGSTTFSDYLTDNVYNSWYCAYDPFCPAKGYVSGSGGANVTPTVTIGVLSQNPILQGNTATVQITVNPSAAINLAITSSGSGEATFDSQGGSTTKTISGTTTVTIYGSAVSSSDGDLTLKASYSGTLLAYAPFSVTSGACTLSGEQDTGSGTKQCPSTVTLQSTYTISRFCNTCQVACTGVHTDGTWTPNGNGCQTIAKHLGDGSLTGTATTSASGTFSASDCNWHYSYFVTSITNAQGVRTDYAGGSIGLMCTSSPNGNPCP